MKKQLIKPLHAAIRAPSFSGKSYLVENNEKYKDWTLFDADSIIKKILLKNRRIRTPLKAINAPDKSILLAAGWRSFKVMRDHLQVGVLPPEDIHRQRLVKRTGNTNDLVVDRLLGRLRKEFLRECQKNNVTIFEDFETALQHIDERLDITYSPHGKLTK